MARGKKDTAEQIVSLLRQVEAGVANGKTGSAKNGGLIPAQGHSISDPAAPWSTATARALTHSCGTSS